MDGGQAQESLEARYRGAAPVDAEGELGEVGLQVGLADAVMGAPQPGLEVFEDPMDMREDLRRPLWVILGLRSVTVTHALQRRIAFPPMGKDDCLPLDIRCDEARKGGRGGVENNVEPDPARILSPHLDGTHHQHFVTGLSSPKTWESRAAPHAHTLPIVAFGVDPIGTMSVTSEFLSLL